MNRDNNGRFIKGHAEGFKKGHKVNLGRKFKYSKEGQEKRRAARKKLVGENHPNWKGGRIKTTRGYISAYCPNHPSSDKKGYVAEHRLIMERFIGRTLKKEEVVHHINGIISDNRIENLMLFTNNKEHLSHHKKARRGQW